MNLERYHSFVLSGIRLEEDIDFKTGIESVRKGYDINAPTKNKSYTITLNTLLRVVADWHGIDVESFPVLGKDRRASQIRAILAYLARSSGDISLREVANVCGRADNSISQAASSLEARMLKSGLLKTR